LVAAVRLRSRSDEHGALASYIHLAAKDRTTLTDISDAHAEQAMLQLLRRSRAKGGVLVTVDNFRAIAGLVIADKAEVHEVEGELKAYDL
jgi:hypothetical protein